MSKELTTTVNFTEVSHALWVRALYRFGMDGVWPILDPDPMEALTTWYRTILSEDYLTGYILTSGGTVLLPFSAVPHREGRFAAEFIRRSARAITLEESHPLVTDLLERGFSRDASPEWGWLVGNHIGRAVTLRWR